MDPQYYQAPVSQKSRGLDKKFMIIMVGALIALLAGGGLLLLSSRSATGDLLARAVTRQQNLYQFTRNSQKNVQSNELSKINSDASLFIASDLTLLRAAMREEGVKEIKESISLSEADSTSSKRLAEAGLNGRYDDTYMAILSQKIDSQQALLREIAAKSTADAIKQMTNNVYDKLENIQKQLNGLVSS